MEDGCESLQVFTRSSRAWESKAIGEEEAELFRRGIRESGLPVICHASYLINLCGPRVDMHRRSVTAFEDELLRCDRLEIPWLVIHPGSCLGTGEEPAIDRMVAAIDAAYDEHPALATGILLENTAGQGDCVGHRFEHLAALRAASRHSRRIGICFDTCHAFAAGYDLRERAGYEKVWAEFDRVIGLAHLKAFHLNDSKKDLHCRVDRHEWIGDGYIGREHFRMLMNDPRFVDLPAVLETPPKENGEMSFKLNLRRLRKLRA